MKKRAVLLFLLTMSILSWSNSLLTASTNESGCIACHTDEAQLKALFVPPKAAPAEGEG